MKYLKPTVVAEITAPNHFISSLCADQRKGHCRRHRSLSPRVQSTKCLADSRVKRCNLVTDCFRTEIEEGGVSWRVSCQTNDLIQTRKTWETRKHDAVAIFYHYEAFVPSLSCTRRWGSVT